ncbi:MAG: TetR/AcrR family transcriptional regulator [Burkholderiales bacterium]|nr:TetR/AcrR family transcriptional regulator [Burkholderiales bacterium]
MKNQTAVPTTGTSVPAPARPRPRGRPLSFDREQAVDRALRLFWAQGYEGTTLSDLTAALGVAPSSIYAAFGDKQGLFLAAVERYLAGPVRSETLIREAPTAREAAQGLLQAAVVGFTGPSTPRGCLLASAAIACSEAARDVQETLAGLRRGIEAQLRQKIQLDIRQGRLPRDADAAALAAHTMAVIQGLSTLARDGASRAALGRVAALALRCWPPGAPG